MAGWKSSDTLDGEGKPPQASTMPNGAPLAADDKLPDEAGAPFVK